MLATTADAAATNDASLVTVVVVKSSSTSSSKSSSNSSPAPRSPINACFDKNIVQTPAKSSINLPVPHLTRDQLVLLLAQTLQDTFCNQPHKMAVNDGKTHKSTFMFQCKTVPEMTITKYFRRLVKYTGVSGESMILSMVHIARVYRTYPNFPINILTIHRLLLTSLLISAKFFDDSFLNNSRYARVGGVKCQELNMLEVELLFLIDFNLYVTETEYAKIFTQLVSTNSRLKFILESTSPKNEKLSPDEKSEHSSFFVPSTIVSISTTSSSNTSSTTSSNTSSTSSTTGDDPNGNPSGNPPGGLPLQNSSSPKNK